MKRIILLLAFVAPLLLSAQTNKHVFSPQKNVMLEFTLDAKGNPGYRVAFAGIFAIENSSLGFTTKETDLSGGFRFVSAAITSHDETWKPVMGEVDHIRDQHNELLVRLINKDEYRMDIRFRVFNDGVGFRYELPKDEGHNTLTFTDEKTAFQMGGDHTAWWIPGDYNSNEHVYTTSKISEINTDPYNQAEVAISAQHIVDKTNVQTPLTMRMADGKHISIAEAALVDFAAMHLQADVKNLRFKAFLIPSPDPAVKSINTLPFHTPWRAILLSEDAAGILNSKLILNLNDPCKLDDVSWIHPTKYVGIWWEMHVGNGTWDYAGGQDMSSATGRAPHGKHSANTANTKKYIDFAAKYGFDGVLVEGWNTGWEDWFGKWKDEVFSFTTPYPDYDIDELTRYAKEKGVKIIMHHETSAAVPSYERQMDDAYAYMKKYNMDAVKTGYVGQIIPRGEWHDGQWMVNHYVRVADRTAKNHIMLDAHEPVRPSGLGRTYPNWVACEAARGNEFNAWSRGNPPEHETILPFNRLLGGPMDYTPGIFETRMSTYKADKTEVVHTTVAKQLALYVTMYSPLAMAADLPENYEKRLDVFQFIRDVPLDYSESRVINASIGDYITYARREKGKDNWYIGSITDENPRHFDMKLDFLKAGKTYEATIYADGPGAHWKDNPYPVSITKKTVRKGDTLALDLAAGGGCAIEIK